MDFANIKKQRSAKRALEIALSGGHSICIIGEPQSGKKTLVKAAKEIMPIGLVEADVYQEHTELFNNESLVYTSWPCSCGYLTSEKWSCTCDTKHSEAAFRTLALLNCDIYVNMEILDFNELSNQRLEEVSEKVKERIFRTKAIQMERQGYLNQSLFDDLTKYCVMDNAASILLKSAFNQLKLSLGHYYSMLKVARTIADNSEHKNICAMDMAEAIQYRYSVRV